MHVITGSVRPEAHAPTQASPELPSDVQEALQSERRLPGRGVQFLVDLKFGRYL